MDRRALYFPYMRVPENDWSTRVLLYWDQVGTIVPYSIDKQREKLGPFTSELMDAQLVSPVYPDGWTSSLSGFADHFFELIPSDQPTVEAYRSAFERDRGTPIHVDKMGFEIGLELERRELAHREEGVEPNSWWRVESTCATVFMTYLATTLGAVQEFKMDPVTDSLDLLVRTSSTHKERVEGLRLALLEAVLPSPEAPVPIDELRRFKGQHGEQLSKFRMLIEEELIDLAAIEDDEARFQKQRLVQDRLRGEVDELAARMRERRWPRVVFAAIGGIAAVGVTAGVAIASGGATLALAAPGLVSSAYSAVQAMKRRDKVQAPVAFAALVDKELA